jgi:hypothetical protein
MQSMQVSRLRHERCSSVAYGRTLARQAHTFRALRKTFGPMWLRCDVCRRYAPFRMGDLADADYRSKTFSCSRCGAEAYLALVEPIKETGMADYRLDDVADPQHHQAAIDRLLAPTPTDAR